MPLPVASLFAAGNLFAAPPPNPGINDPIPANSPPPLPRPGRRRPTTPLPKRQQPSKSPPAQRHTRNPPPSPRRSRAPPSPNPALRATHSRTRYFKPVPDGGVLPADDGSGRAVVIGPSGLSYRLPGAPFEFQFSYSEAPKAKPIAIREPAFLPFAPPTMNRPWTGKAPLLSKKEKERKKKVRLFEPLGQSEISEEDEEGEEEVVGGKVMHMDGSVVELGQYPEDGRSREEILGAPLKRWEIRALIKPCLSSNKQVNLGRDGLTHNMLELIHSHWRRQQVCKVRCRGVPTVDMDNVCHHLEEKTGGKIIHRAGGIAYLFRGRHYDPRTRPRYPIMLWKPAAPVYPKLIQEAPEGLTKPEADELRKKGGNLLPICKLAKNGIYVDLVKDVRDAFEGSELVKVNCQGMDASDYKKLGAKLKELVPCVLLSFDDEQILMWRGREWKSSYKTPLPFDSKTHQSGNHDSSHQNASGQSSILTSEGKFIHKKLSRKMLSLWKRAVESEKALLLDDTTLDPDSLLQRVEEFEALIQASKHSYHALILPSQGDPNTAAALDDSILGTETNGVYNPNDSDPREIDEYDRSFGYDDDDFNDLLDDIEPLVPFGHLTIDSIAEESQ